MDCFGRKYRQFTTLNQSYEGGRHIVITNRNANHVSVACSSSMMAHMIYSRRSLCVWNTKRYVTQRADGIVNITDMKTGTPENGRSHVDYLNNVCIFE